MKALRICALGSLAIVMALSIPFLLPANKVQAAEEDIEINEENFPDANFRSWVKSNCDADGNGVLSAEERAEVTYIDVRAKQISNLKNKKRTHRLCSRGAFLEDLLQGPGFNNMSA